MSTNFLYRVRPTQPRRPACKFLVPFHLTGLLERRLRKFGDRMSDYLPYLIRRARGQTGRLPSRGHFTTLYQEDALDLHPVNFRVSGEDWGEFKTIARGLGVSMCLLFVALLEMDGDTMQQASEGSTKTNIFLTEIISEGVKRLRRGLRVRRLRPGPAAF